MGACRCEQRFEFDGGHGIAFFSVMSGKDLLSSFMRRGPSLVQTFFQQGDPPYMSTVGKALHLWVPGGKVKESSVSPDGRDIHHHNEAMPKEFEADKSGWSAWSASMKKAAHLLLTNPELKYKQGNYPNYQYDRVTFARTDYYFKNPISVYELNTTAMTYIAFGAKDFPSVPTLIVTSHKGLLYLGHRSLPNNDELKTPESAITCLKSLLGLPVKVLNI